MIGVSRKPCDAEFRMSSAYTVFSAFGSAAVRCATGFPVWSRPPMVALRSANCAAVIVPAFSAARPYCTPVVSSGLRTNPVLGSRPIWLASCSLELHFTPRGLVTGSHRAETGMAALQLPVAVARLAKVWSQETHVS
jgi:hypothetical protein